MSNKILTIIFIILLALFGLNRMFRNTQSSSFDKTFTSIKKEKIDRIEVYSKSESPTYSLELDGGFWVGRSEGNTYKLNQDRVESFISSFSDIQIQRLASKSSEKWDNYEVGETSGTRIKAYQGDDLLIDFVIGRFNFNQQTRSATSYIRKSSQDEVYAMDGFASMTLNQDFDGLRYNQLLEVDADNIVEIEADIDGNSFSIIKDQNNWKDFIGNTLDSASVASYINSIESLTSSNFYDQNPENIFGSVDIKLSDQNIKTIKIFRDSSAFILSSAESEDMFLSDSTGVFSTLVLELKNLLK